MRQQKTERYIGGERENEREEKAMLERKSETERGIYEREREKERERERERENDVCEICEFVHVNR